MTYKNSVAFKEEFRDIIKRQRYEKVILPVLNRSTQLISNLPLTYVENQSNGESDYLDVKNHKYDVKLLMNPEQGSYLGEQKNDIKLWFYAMIKETEEFSNCLAVRNLYAVAETKFYKLTKRRISDFRQDETGILFIPYPIVSDYRDDVYLQFATDFVQAVFNQLEEEKAITCERMLLLYPSTKSGILVLRDSNRREYINAPEITEYIDYVVESIEE